MTNYTRSQLLQKHISILESAISRGLIYTSDEWMEIVYHDIEVLEIEVELIKCINKKRLKKHD